jgi:hypothetical protein
MRIVILTIAFMLGITSYAQTTKKEKLAKGIKGWEIYRTISGKDTTVYFRWGFQNMKYQYITDIGSIMTSYKSELKNFAEKLIEYGNIKGRVHQSDYVPHITTIQLYDFSSNIYIQDGDKYTIITKRTAVKMGNEILKYYELLNQ